MPLLEGTDGIKKMSKSTGNYIAINDVPDEMFGKIMSISDEMLWRYYELLSFSSLEDIAKFKEEVNQGANPRDYKIRFAQEIISRYHDVATAQKSKDNFIARFQKGAIPDDIKKIELQTEAEGIGIANLLKEANLVSSTSDAFRMLKQGAVKVDGEKISDKTLMLTSGFNSVVQVGKRRFAKITLK
jgi:tyrosyl-tRNA synthetase